MLMQNLIGSGEEDQIYGGKKKVCLATLPALLTGKFKKKKNSAELLMSQNSWPS